MTNKKLKILIKESSSSRLLNWSSIGIDILLIAPVAEA